MFDSLRPVLKHLVSHGAVPKRMLIELLRGPWKDSEKDVQVLLDHGVIQQANGRLDAYVLGRHGKKLLGYKRLDYEPSQDSVRLDVLKRKVTALLKYADWQLDEGDQLVDKGDLAFNTPEGGRAYLRCTLKDVSVGELKLMLARYIKKMTGWLLPHVVRKVTVPTLRTSRCLRSA